MEKDTLKEIIYQQGADVCGIANIERFEHAPKGFHPTDILSNAKSVVVFGKQFLKGVFISSSNVPYSLVRNQLIQEMDNLAIKIAYLLEEKGYIAVPVPSSEPYEYWDMQQRYGRGIISLKHAAQLAGLGSLGKNTLLINEKYGNRLWLGGIITTLDLESDQLTKNYCPPNCQICINSCPKSALNEITIDQSKCREICFSSTEGGGWLIACNICRITCPFSLS
jgi:epoxyqueuosine reductase